MVWLLQVADKSIIPSELPVLFPVLNSNTKFASLQEKVPPGTPEIIGAGSV